MLFELHIELSKIGYIFIIQMVRPIDVHDFILTVQLRSTNNTPFLIENYFFIHSPTGCIQIIYEYKFNNAVDVS